MKIFLFVVICHLLLSKFAMASEADVFIVTEEWFPFNYEKDGEVKGAATEVVKRMLEDAGLSYTLDLYDWEKSYRLASQEPNMLIYSIYKTPGRMKYFHWICPIYRQHRNAIWALTSREDIQIKQEKDLLAYSIALARGTYPIKTVKEMGFVEDRNLHLTTSNQTNFMLFINQRVDLLIEVEEALYQSLLLLGLNKSLVKKVYSMKDEEQPELCLAVSKKTPSSVVAKIRKAHNKLFPVKASQQEARRNRVDK